VVDSALAKKDRADADATPEDATPEDATKQDSSQQDGQAVAIRVAVIPLDDRENIFVKMTGDFDLIQSQSEKMDQFVDSLVW